MPNQKGFIESDEQLRNLDTLLRNLQSIDNTNRILHNHTKFTRSLKEHIHILDTHGVDLTQLLGCGGTGCVFATDNDDIVAKFTLDEYEIKLFDRLKDNPLQGFVEVVDVLYIGYFGLILRESVIPFSDIELTNVEWDVIEKAIRDARYGLDSAAIRQAIQMTSLFGWDFNPILNTFNSLRLMDRRVGDIRLGNIGLVGNKMVIFDAAEEW